LPEQVKKEYGLNPNDKIILFASMNFEIKGLDAIIAALARLKSRGKRFKLVIAGKGNTGKYFRIADQAGIGEHIIFAGTLNKESLIRLYLAGDVYVMLSRFDTFGMVVLEAMAAGLPVIISSNVGAKDLVREGKNGFVIKDTSDTDYIANKICLTLEKSATHEMSGFALETAAQNTWEFVTAKYQAIYTDIMAQRERKV
jgi:UDP-glucose:(heptosyl)LPS alpha-1,3-glucosyltransferase